MATGSRAQPSSVDEVLIQMHADAASIGLAPDATAEDMQFSKIMQQGILQFRQAKAHNKAQQATQMGQQAAMGGAGGGPPGMAGAGMGGPPGAGPGGAGAGGGGGAPPAAAPQQIAPGGGPGMSGYGGVVQNPDELQRILAGTGGQ